MGFSGWQWHQLDHMQTTCTSLQTDNHINTSSLNLYRPDALPGAQPCRSTEGTAYPQQIEVVDFGHYAIVAEWTSTASVNLAFQTVRLLCCLL